MTTNPSSKPRKPTKLGPAGRRLWQEMTELLELRPDELSILEDACREADLIARLEDAIRDEPLTTKGSMGQTVAHPLVQEIRQHRATKAGLLRKLDIPADDGAGSAAASSAAGRALVAHRWRMAG